MVDSRDPLLEITSAFDLSRDQAAHDKAQQEIFDLRQTEIKIGENKLNPENTAKVTNNTRMCKHTETEQKRKDRKSHEHHMLMVTLEQLRENLQALEAELIEKYGEDFAENLAAELLDEKAYTEIMLISDQDERRRQIAIEINRGLADGSIDASVVEQNQDFKHWLQASDSVERHRSFIASQKVDTELGLKTTADDAVLNGSEDDLTASEATHGQSQNANLSAGLDSVFGK